MNSANHDHDEFSIDLEWDQNFTIPYTDDFPLPLLHNPLDGYPRLLPSDNGLLLSALDVSERSITTGVEPYEKAMHPNPAGMDSEGYAASLSPSSYDTDNSDT